MLTQGAKYLRTIKYFITVKKYSYLSYDFCWYMNIYNQLLWHCLRCSQGGYINPILVHNLPWLRTSNVDRFNESKLLYTRKSKKETIPHIKNITDYTDKIALLANTSVQAESLIHSLERAAGGRGLHVNTDKTEYMSFNQRDDISTLNGGSLKQVDKFTYEDH